LAASPVRLSALATTNTWPRASNGDTWAVRSMLRVASTEVEALRSRSSTRKSGWNRVPSTAASGQTIRRQWRQTPQGRSAAGASQSRARARVRAAARRASAVPPSRITAG
jgi:hypothetical protein